MIIIRKPYYCTTSWSFCITRVCVIAEGV